MYIAFSFTKFGFVFADEFTDDKTWLGLADQFMQNLYLSIFDSMDGEDVEGLRYVKFIW